MEYDYWESIPIGKENAISYGDLASLWCMDRRAVRFKLNQLSQQDNGDGFVLIRTSKMRGFYRTDNRDEIEAYRREVYNRARHTFAPFRKINRILGQNESQLVIELWS